MRCRRRSLLAHVCFGLLFACSAAFAWADDGYVGVYGDSLGTVPCVTVPAGSVATLYVVAHLSGATSAGITGAEFRVEVSDPTGWFFSYTAPPDAKTTMGDLLGTGVSLAYASCRTPTNGTVPFGTIGVYNASGSPTELGVKRHDEPTNLDYICPFFTLCDDPVFSKSCMTPTPQPPCSTLSAKPLALTDPDPPVFRLALNPQPPPPPPPVPESQPFVDAFSLAGPNLWVGGRRVRGRWSTCGSRTTNSPSNELSFNGEVVTFTAPPPPPRTAERIERTYGNVPRVAELRAAGRSVSEAADQFLAEVEELEARAVAAYKLRGFPAALAEFEASPLIEEIAEAYEMHKLIKVKRRGMRAHYAIYLERPRRVGRQAQTPPDDKETKARRLVAELRAMADWDALVLVSRAGNYTVLGGERRALAEAQIAHVLAGGSLGTLPDGPIRANAWTIRELQLQPGRSRPCDLFLDPLRARGCSALRNLVRRGTISSLCAG
ncbi:MAG: hypothetical protein ACE5G2_00755 [Candidatus Krumholzibacteriia bacterium]